MWKGILKEGLETPLQLTLANRVVETSDDLDIVELRMEWLI